MAFEEYLIEQLERHPSMRPQDIVKMCYQAAHGAEHLLNNPGAAKKYLEQEYAEVAAETGDLYENISDHVCRVNLAAWKAKKLPLEWLFRMFVDSAKIFEDSGALFEEYLCCAEKMLNHTEVAFSRQEWAAYLAAYKNQGMPSVHHSEQYRKCEAPAYRIIDRRFCRAFPILERVELPTDSGQAYVIAIDGKAASGKTSLADLLKVILEADVIQMDDFFLPLELRTEERLCTPGGNVHYERFAKEVLPALSKPQEFSYGIFNCAKMDFDGMREIGNKQMRIVEGSYSTHPIFGKYAQLTVFTEVSAEEQIERIRNRNGDAMLKLFREKWIPMEEQYFAHYGIKEKVDISLNS